MKAKSNPIVKWTVIGGVLVTIFILASRSGGNGKPPPPPPAQSTSAISSSDNVDATLQTFVQKDAARTREIQLLKDSNYQLSTQIQDILAKGAQQPPNTNTDSIRQDMQAQQLEMRSELDKLAKQLNDAVEQAKNGAAQVKGQKLSDMKNPLDRSKSRLTEYEIDGERQSDTIVWVDPIDAPQAYVDGVFQATQWVENKASSAKSAVSGAVDKSREQLEVKPVLTIPENTTIVGAKLASRIVALVPKNGAVNSPMGFKLVIPAKVMAANGFDIPELAYANVGGYAIGNYSLSCARGYITSLTYVFEDGRIAQVGSNQAAAGGDGKNVGADALAVLTDTAGTECVSGDFKTDAPEFLTTSTILGAATGAASAYAGAQQTVTKGNTGTETDVTGSVGKYVAGQSAVSGLNQGSAYLNELWASSWDVVVVDIGTAVNIEVKKPISIDYDPKGRMVRHPFTLDERKTEMESYWR